MRIAYVCADFGIPVHGNKGASIHVRELSRSLQALGHDVAVFTPRAGGTTPSDFGVPIRELRPEPAEEVLYGLLRNDPAAGESVALAVRSAVYAQTLRHRIRADLAGFSPDVIYERFSLFGTSGLGLARDLGVPLIVEVNAPLTEEHAVHRGLAFADTARELERLVLRSADRLIAVSRELERWLVELGVEPERVTVLPNGVDVARFEKVGQEGDELRARFGLAGGRVVGFVGTLKPWHGTETLVRAVAALHRRGTTAHLLVVGDGPERVRLEALARAEGIAHATTFTGSVAHERVPAYVAAMDVAAAPYSRAENFYFSPLKLFEYMAAGRAVVAAEVGQIRECVRHRVTGWLYPPGDVGALADAIGTLLQDPALATSLGRAARAHVRERHTWAANARAVVALARPLPPRAVRAEPSGVGP